MRSMIKLEEVQIVSLENRVKDCSVAQVLSILGEYLQQS